MTCPLHKTVQELQADGSVTGGSVSGTAGAEAGLLLAASTILHNLNPFPAEGETDARIQAALNIPLEVQSAWVREEMDALVVAAQKDGAEVEEIAGGFGGVTIRNKNGQEYTYILTTEASGFVDGVLLDWQAGVVTIQLTEANGTQRVYDYYGVSKEEMVALLTAAALAQARDHKIYTLVTTHLMQKYGQDSRLAAAIAKVARGELGGVRIEDEDVTRPSIGSIYNEIIKSHPYKENGSTTRCPNGEELEECLARRRRRLALDYENGAPRIRTEKLEEEGGVRGRGTDADSSSRVLDPNRGLWLWRRVAEASSGVIVVRPDDFRDVSEAMDVLAEIHPSCLDYIEDGLLLRASDIPPVNSGNAALCAEIEQYVGDTVHGLLDISNDRDAKTYIAVGEESVAVCVADALGTPQRCHVLRGGRPDDTFPVDYAAFLPASTFGQGEGKACHIAVALHLPGLAFRPFLQEVAIAIPTLDNDASPSDISSSAGSVLQYVARFDLPDLNALPWMIQETLRMEIGEDWHIVQSVQEALGGDGIVVQYGGRVILYKKDGNTAVFPYITDVTPVEATKPVKVSDVSPDENLLALSNGDDIQVYDLRNMQRCGVIVLEGGLAVDGIAFAEDGSGKIIILNNGQKKVAIVDPASVSAFD